MTFNMGSTDRVFRFIVAVVIAAAWYAGLITGTLALVLGIVAVVFLITSVVGFCPLYALFGKTSVKNVPV